MDRIKIINMIPSKTVKNHFIENNIKLTPIEELTVARHCFKDIVVKGEFYEKFTLYPDNEVKDLAMKLQEELNKLKSYINNESGEYNFQINGSDIVYSSFKSLVNSGITEYCKVHIETTDHKKLIATLWLNNEKDIIFYKLWNEEEVLSIFNIRFSSLPFKHRQLLKPVEQLFENQGESYVNLSNMDEPVPGVLAIVNMNDYITDIDHADDEPPIYYMSPLYLEDYGLEG